MEQRMRHMASEAIDAAGLFLERATEGIAQDAPTAHVVHDIRMAIMLLQSAEDVVDYNYKPTVGKF